MRMFFEDTAVGQTFEEEAVVPMVDMPGLLREAARSCVTPPCSGRAGDPSSAVAPSVGSLKAFDCENIGLLRGVVLLERLGAPRAVACWDCCRLEGCTGFVGDGG